MTAITLPGGTIFTVHYTIGPRKVLPTHYQGQREASILNGRLGIIVDREETPEWMHIYRCLVGSHDISLGLGWILVSELPETLCEPLMASVGVQVPDDLKD